MNVQRLWVFLFIIVVKICQLSDALPFGDVQSYAANGTVLCDGQPAPMLKVRLFDHDKFTEDDLMGESSTDAAGHFHVHGHSQELTEIEPYLRIYHHCGDQGEFLYVHCPLVRVQDLDGARITVGEQSPLHVHQVGEINLRGKFRADEDQRECL